MHLLDFAKQRHPAVEPTFDALIALRAEPELKAAIGTVAEREMTTLGAFCRELRGIVKARLARSDDAGPAPSRPDRRHRIAA